MKKILIAAILIVISFFTLSCGGPVITTEPTILSVEATVVEKNVVINTEGKKEYHILFQFENEYGLTCEFEREVSIIDYNFTYTLDKVLNMEINENEIEFCLTPQVPVNE